MHLSKTEAYRQSDDSLINLVYSLQITLACFQKYFIVFADLIYKNES